MKTKNIKRTLIFQKEKFLKNVINLLKIIKIKIKILIKLVKQKMIIKLMKIYKIILILILKN